MKVNLEISFLTLVLFVLFFNLIYRFKAIRSIQKIEFEVSPNIVRLLNFNIIFAFLAVVIIIFFIFLSL